VDFKTGSKPPTLSKNSVSDDLQMNTYCLAVRALYGALPVRAVLYFLKENRVVAYSPDEQSIARFEARAVAMMDAIQAGRFAATPNYAACRHCDYKDLCDEKEAKEA
ncbi:MAG: Dna2/Cas4 domain-containing protein, partial [Methanobacteriota archaeon]